MKLSEENPGGVTKTKIQILKTINVHIKFRVNPTLIFQNTLSWTKVLVDRNLMVKSWILIWKPVSCWCMLVPLYHSSIEATTNWKHIRLLTYLIFMMIFIRTLFILNIKMLKVRPENVWNFTTGTPFVHWNSVLSSFESGCTELLFFAVLEKKIKIWMCLLISFFYIEPYGLNVFSYISVSGRLLLNFPV